MFNPQQQIGNRRRFVQTAAALVFGGIAGSELNCDFRRTQQVDLEKLYLTASRLNVELVVMIATAEACRSKTGDLPFARELLDSRAFFEAWSLMNDLVDLAKVPNPERIKTILVENYEGYSEPSIEEGNEYLMLLNECLKQATDLSNLSSEGKVEADMVRGNVVNLATAFAALIRSHRAVHRYGDEIVQRKRPEPPTPRVR